MADLVRRNFLRGLLAAPFVIRTPGLLMPIRKLPIDWEYLASTRRVLYDQSGNGHHLIGSYEEVEGALGRMFEASNLSYFQLHGSAFEYLTRQQQRLKYRDAAAL